MSNTISFKKKLSHSIELLKKSEKMALRYSDKGFFLAFSGGKDSQALYHVAKMAGVKFEAHYAITTIDPPELVHFIRNNYPDVINDRPELTFSQLCLKKRMLPTRTIRFCCSVLKETKGAGTVTLTGVRREESVNRRKRNEAEIISTNKGRRYSSTYEQLDQFTRIKEIEGVSCIKGRDKIVINPIIDWTYNDVWYFLNEVAKVTHCELYDKGWHRIGCLFCPMANKKEIAKMELQYPKYKSAIIRIIHKLRGFGYFNNFDGLTDEDVFCWWVSRQNVRTWYINKKMQKEFIYD